MSLRAVRDAVIADLETRLPGAVFKPNEVPAGTERYAVVFISRPQKNRARYSGQQVQDLFTVTVHSVGVEDDSCLWVQERVDELTGRVLNVPGKRLRAVEYVTGRPPDSDDDGPTPLLFAVSQFDIVSDPA